MLSFIKKTLEIPLNYPFLYKIANTARKLRLLGK